MSFMFLSFVFISGILHGLSGSGFPIITTIIASSIFGLNQGIYLLIVPTLCVNILSCILSRINI